MLKDLTKIPHSLKCRKALLMASTGLVLHEVGHIVAAALAGVPTDYLVIDKTPNATQCATYIHPNFRGVLRGDVAAQIRIAAAGFAAEHLVFGDAFLNRSEEDLRHIAGLLEMPFAESAMQSIAERTQNLHGPIIPIDAIDVLHATSARVAAALESRRYEVDGAHMVPFYVFRHPELPIPWLWQLTATVRTRVGTDRGQIIASLRGGVESGL